MKVKYLIKKLQEYDENMEVYFDNNVPGMYPSEIDIAKKNDIVLINRCMVAAAEVPINTTQRTLNNSVDNIAMSEKMSEEITEKILDNLRRKELYKGIGGGG